MNAHRQAAREHRRDLKRLRIAGDVVKLAVGLLAAAWLVWKRRDAGDRGKENVMPVELAEKERIDLSDLEALTLASGKHLDRSNGLCVMEAVNKASAAHTQIRIAVL